MNGDKTEIMICGTIPKMNNIDIDSINIDNDPIDISDHVRNLGFFLDKHLNMNVHVSNLRKTCYYEFKKISNIRHFIIEKCAAQLAVSLVLTLRILISLLVWISSPVGKKPTAPISLLVRISSLVGKPKVVVHVNLTQKTLILIIGSLLVLNNQICWIMYNTSLDIKYKYLFAKKITKLLLVAFFSFVTRLTPDLWSICTCQPVHFGFARNQKSTLISSPAWTNCYRIN